MFFCPRRGQKYGLSNFSLLILEFLDESLLTEREQFWLDFLQPEYNVLKFAYRSTGFQHSPEARELIRQSALGRKHSAETRERISASIKGQDNPFFGRTHSIEVRQKISMMNTLSKIYLYDEFKSLRAYLFFLHLLILLH